MLYDNLRRGLSLMLAFVVAFLFLPLLAHTAEAETPEVSNATVDTTAVTEPANENEISAEDIMQELQQEMDKILLKYLHATVLTEDEVIDIVNTMYWDDMEEAVAACEALESKLAALGEDERIRLENQYEGANTITYFYETMRLAMVPSFFAATGTHTPVAGVVVDVTGASDNSMNDVNEVTVTAKSAKKGLIFVSYTPTTATLIITNSSETDKATVSFDWTGTNVNSLKINNISRDDKASGSYGQLLEAGASITVTLTSGNNTTTNTLVLKNFKWEKAADTSKVKFDYDSTLGSVTVDGAAMADEGEKDIPLTGAALVATAGSNATFLGWIDGNNKILSTAASFTLKPTAAMTAKAVFVSKDSTEAWFRVGTDYLFNDLNAADNFAKTATNRLITLIRSGTLPAGKTYTISSGNSFLIPYSDTDTGCFGGTPETVETEAGADGAYLTLTIPDNTELVVAGAMSVNAKQGTPGAGDTGQVTGKFGHVILNGSNAKITVNGSLTCYGYITGSGVVHATNGAKVYELFQLRDWRGGTATMSWYMRYRTKSFVVNEYYIQNIESKYRVDGGALSYVSAAMSMTGIGVQQAQAVYIGSGGLFQLGEGSFVIREYKASEDRIYYELYGSVTTAGINLTVSIYDLDTSNFILGIHHSMTITVKGKDLNGNVLKSYATLTKAFKLLPGAELIIEENGTLEVDPSTTLYLYDLNDWVKDGTAANSYIYWGNDSFTSVQSVRYTPSTKGTRKTQQSAVLKVDGTLIGNSNIFSTYDDNVQDIVLTGSGTFTNKAAASGYEQVELDEIKNNDPGSVVTIETVPIVGLLAGISEDSTDVNDSFGTATYHGVVLDDGNWWFISKEEQNPTCTEDGYTLYWCEEGKVKKVAGDPATGHTWVWADGECSVCGEKAVRYDAVNLSIEGEILLNFKYYIHEDAIGKGIEVTVTEEGNAIVPGGVTWTETVTNDFKEAKGSRYVISQGIAAGEMTGNVTVSFAKDGVPVPIFDNDNLDADPVNSMTKTVTEFAQIVFDNDDTNRVALAELKEMCKAAVTFGGYAQKFYGTDTENPAYNILNTNNEMDFKPDVSGADVLLAQVDPTTFDGSNGVKATTQKLNLDSKIYIRTYFTLPTEEEYSFKITGPDNNSAGTLTKDGDKDRYYVDIVNVPPAYWDDEYTIEITGNGGTYTVKTNVLAWCARCINSNDASNEQKNMARAMYFYNQKAQEYFNAKNSAQ